VKRRGAAISLAAASWILLVLRWFDAAAPFRPAWLASVPPAVLALLCAVPLFVLMIRERRAVSAASSVASDKALWLVIALTVLFRLPLAWQGAAGYVTPDGALSGIVALHVRDGADHLVFVPHVPYSGSLKSHAAALVATVIEPARAFAMR